MEILKQFIVKQVRQLTVVPQGKISMTEPIGDPGLFGPGSVVWEVHRDFTGMMIGGIASLLLQMLHPLALAGVWDHSNFRQDMQGRLRRTSQFVGGTSFAATPSVDWLINRVREIHSKVEGVAPDGRAYRADDPALLTWVHTAEVYCFLSAYRRYFNPQIPLWAQDRYYAEVALVAQRLGAEDIPVSVSAVEAYLTKMRSELVYTDRTAEVYRLISAAKPGSLVVVPVMRLFMAAAVDLLPHWAQVMLHKQLSPWQVPLVRQGVRRAAPLIRKSVKRGAFALAHERMGLVALPSTVPAQFPVTPPDDVLV